MTSRREFIRYTGAALAAASTPFPALAEPVRQLTRRKIPGTDESLAVVGYGNARAFGEGDMDVSRELIDLFLEHGGSYVDTSGNGRNTIGTIMRERNAHDQLFLGTYINGEDLQSMRDEIAEVLDVQGGESLDLVLSRAPIDFGKRRDQYRQLKEDGVTRYVGVGRYNERFYPPMMELMNDGAVDLIQVNYSMMEPGAADEILPLAQEKNIAVIINRPFMNGDYFGMVRGQELPEWAADFDCDSWAQFSLKYILANPTVNCVLTETSNPEHAIDNLGAGFGRLPDADERKRMEAVIRALM
jgi:aryl-alcohol dehydrogenase-like predicted oxidoreductase